MSRVDEIEPLFVGEIPQELAPGKLYISIAYGTATHLCCCGCGNEVVTPIHPTRWAVTFDGETVSLNPSVGSWSLRCQSHYVIKKNRVRWAERWSADKIEAGRARERRQAEAHFSRDGWDTPVRGDGGPSSRPDGRLRRLWRAFSA